MHHRVLDFLLSLLSVVCSVSEPPCFPQAGATFCCFVILGSATSADRGLLAFL
jgi:hypothetical protein